MKKIFTILMIFIMIQTNIISVFALSNYQAELDKTSYEPGTPMVVDIDTSIDDWFSVEIIKGDITLMSLPYFPEDGHLEITFLIPANWENGNDYILRVGRGTDISSKSFEIQSKKDDAIYTLIIDKTAAKVGDVLVLTGTSNTNNSTIQYLISSSDNSFTPKTGDVTIENQKFESSLNIDSTYAVGNYMVKVGSNDVFSNECSFSVIASEQVKTPTFSPNGGTFTDRQNVTISCSTSNATIYYTTDGTAPTTSSNVYSSQFTLTSTTTVKAMAVKDGMTNSEVKTVVFTRISGGGGGSGTGSKNNSGNFPIPTPTIAPSAEPEPATNASETVVEKFTDIQNNDWFYDSVKSVVDKGLFSGISEDTFAPDSQMTRAMTITVLARHAGAKTDGGEQWWTKSVEWGVENGITDGADLENNVTREQLVALLWRYAGQPAGIGDLSGFNDQDSISDWAIDAMKWANGSGLLSGYPDNTIQPKGNATRAEVAAIIHRFTENS